MSVTLTPAPPTETTAEAAPPRRKWPIGRSVVIVIVALFLVWTLWPIYWMVSTSLKPAKEATNLTPTIWPHTLTGANYRELFGKVDAVSIAVPTVDHVQVGLDCLEHGIDILVEKPIAATLEQAAALIEVRKRPKPTRAPAAPAGARSVPSASSDSGTRAAESGSRAG